MISPFFIHSHLVFKEICVISLFLEERFAGLNLLLLLLIGQKVKYPPGRNLIHVENVMKNQVN